MIRWSLLAVLASCGGAEKPVAPPPPLDPDLEPKTCPVPPSTPRAQMMPSSLVESRRTAGVQAIVPDDLTKEKIHQQQLWAVRAEVLLKIHQQQLWAVRAEVLLCLDDTGTPTTIELTSSSCVPDYDAKLLHRMADWRYRPFEISGKPAAVCTNVVFVYRQSSVRKAAP